MNKKRDITHNKYPEELLLSGEWEQLSLDEHLELERLGVDEEQFTAMRALLMESSKTTDKAAHIQASQGLKGNLLDLFDEVHGRNRLQGKRLMMRRRRMFLTGVAASLAVMLMVGGAFFFFDDKNAEQTTQTDKLAQNRHEQPEPLSDQAETVMANEGESKTASKEQPVPSSDSFQAPKSALPRPDATIVEYKPQTITRINGDVAQVDLVEEIDTDRETVVWTANTAEQIQVTDSDLTVSLSQTTQKGMPKTTQKTVTGVRIENTSIDQSKTDTPIQTPRPARKDTALFRFLYACQ
jgi:hypothetical protein